MATNLELKIEVRSHLILTKKLKLIKAKYCNVLNQKDVYYRCTNGLLKLRIENGKYYLIKYKRNENGKRWSDYDILELYGNNPEKYLADVFQIETVIEKTRKLYLFKNTRIHLDLVKNLGRFLELETLVVKNKIEAQKEFDEVVQLLELNLSKQIHDSYKNLLSI